MKIPKIFNPENLDYDCYVNLQKKSYEELFNNVQISDNFVSPEFYNWKYRPPAGAAKIAIIFENGEMVASNAMFPLYIRDEDKTILGWHSCDTATLPRARGKGYYRRCLHALKEELGGNQIFFGFPNKNSYRGFNELGCRENGLVTSWVNIFPLNLKKLHAEQIVEVKIFGIEQDELSDNIVSLGGPMLDRSSSYLNWRYCHHPLFKYFKFVFKNDRGLKGVIILRITNFFKKNFVLIMELWGISPNVENMLVKKAKIWSSQNKIYKIIMMNNNLSLLNGIRSAFIPLPSKLLPKRQVLMGFATNGNAETFMIKRWRMMTGDWDSF